MPFISAKKEKNENDQLSLMIDGSICHDQLKIANHICNDFANIAHGIGNTDGTTVEPRFNEVAGDRPNLFVKWRVRYIENLDITNLRGNDQNVRYIEVIVND